MSSADGASVFARMQACGKALTGLQSYRRPVVPRNDEGLWAAFAEKMGECVRHFDAFRGSDDNEMQNLRRAQKSLGEADERLQAWAGGSAVLYNRERGI